MPISATELQPQEQQQPQETEERQECDFCSRALPIRDLAETTDDRMICDECRDRVQSCGRCVDCENVIPSRWPHARYNGQRLCERCYDANYSTCGDCEEVYLREDGHECECESDCDDDIIQDHSSKPCLSPLGTGPHYYGIELEVETRGTSSRGYCAELVLERASNRFCICKEDGSLDNGFEIVSRPASLECAKTEWARILDNIPGGLVSYPKYSTGIHVHCSRQPLTCLGIGRMLVFINHPANRNFVETIAQRNANDFCRAMRKRLTDGAKTPEGKYEQLNIRPRDTIEFRLFKGTLKKASVFKDIEFCDALIHWTKPAEVGMTHAVPLSSYGTREGLVKEFRTYVADNSKTWPHLAAFVDAKWMGKETDATKQFNFKAAGTPGIESEES